eukprot:359710-Chlamydomonas_euryale.AAC.5
MGDETEAAPGRSRRHAAAAPHVRVRYRSRSPTRARFARSRHMSSHQHPHSQYPPPVVCRLCAALPRPPLHRGRPRLRWLAAPASTRPCAAPSAAGL